MTRFVGYRSCVVVLGLCLSACQTPSLPRAMPLSQSQWVVTQVNGQAWPSQPRLDPFLHFNANGHIVGRAVCNRLVGSYTQQDRQLQFQALGSTRIACLEDKAQLESQLLEAYRSTTTFQAQKNTLLLRDGTGQVRVRLQRATASS